MKRPTILSIIFISAVIMLEPLLVSEVRAVDKQSDITESVNMEEKVKTTKVSLQDQLIQAIKDADGNKVKMLINKGAQVNRLKKEIKDKSGKGYRFVESIKYSPLYLALDMKNEYKDLKEAYQDFLKYFENDISMTRLEMLINLSDRRSCGKEERDVENITYFDDLEVACLEDVKADKWQEYVTKEEILVNLEKFTQKEEAMDVIITLLKNKGAKKIYQKDVDRGVIHIDYGSFKWNQNN